MNFKQKGIIFYDGDCGLCNRFVLFCLKFRASPFDVRFAPLQGDTAASLLPIELRNDLSTVVYYAGNDELYLRSDAVIQIAASLRFPAKYLKYLWFMPRSLRDFCYKVVANWRQRFSRQLSCQLPNEEERSYFLP